MPSVFYPTYVQGDLHPECEALLTRISAANEPPLHAMSPAEARRAFMLPEWLGAPREGVTVCKTQAGEIPIRIYTPEGEMPKPVLMFFHGGGFVLGNLDEFEPFSTFLAAGGGCIVVSVDYRLAPESPFPAALDDAWAATQWAAAHASSFNGDPTRIAVAGDSAGGNLAAVVSALAGDQGFPKLIHQTLICPWVDLSVASESTDSFRHFGEGLWLSTASTHWFRNHYLRDLDQSEDARVSPLRARSLRGLPPSLVILAEYDVLADQGRSYAQRLQAAGVPVVQSCYPGMLHDFVTLPGLFTPAWNAIDQITAVLRNTFAHC
jgi:acetyl esterase